MAKLKSEDYVDIVKRILKGETHGSIAADYPVGRRRVSDIHRAIVDGLETSNVRKALEPIWTPILRTQLGKLMNRRIPSRDAYREEIEGIMPEHFAKLAMKGYMRGYRDGRRSKQPD